MTFRVEIEQEEDGRWLAEVVELPVVMVYGKTPEEAKAKAQALALRTLADRLENGESESEHLNGLFHIA
jgi:predicted RNase H-like HicB family nuclease